MEELYTICPREGDVIIHTFGLGVDFNTMSKTHSELIHTFPDNHVITIPDVNAVYCLDRQSTLEMLRAMIEMIEGNDHS